MTMIKCIYCHYDYHIGKDWELLCEDYGGGEKEIGVCRDCWEKIRKGVMESILTKEQNKIIKNYMRGIEKEFMKKCRSELNGNK